MATCFLTRGALAMLLPMQVRPGAQTSDVPDLAGVLQPRRRISSSSLPRALDSTDSIASLGSP